LFVHFHSTVDRWKSYFSRLINAHASDEFKDPLVNTAGELVPKVSFMEVEIATEKCKHYESRGINIILADLLQAVDRTLR
jgi:hypothetical protein